MAVISIIIKFSDLDHFVLKKSRDNFNPPLDRITIRISIQQYLIAPGWYFIDPDSNPAAAKFQVLEVWAVIEFVNINLIRSICFSFVIVCVLVFNSVC